MNDYFGCLERYYAKQGQASRPASGSNNSSKRAFTTIGKRKLKYGDSAVSTSGMSNLKKNTGKQKAN